jgi:predicted dehydrogenase
VPLYTTDATDILDNPAIRLVYIASNHHSHAEYAIQGLLRGKDVYVEKPHVVTEDQLHGLVDVMSASAGRVYLGFNRPQSRLARILQRYLQEQAGPALLNWFVAGHEIEPDHWYFHTDEGGRVLGNLCHWTDFLLSFAGPDPFPIRIVPVRSVSRDVDVVVSYVFRDHTIGTISFSAKGHAFEGVREKLNVHKGNCLAVLDDFQRLRIDVVERRHTFRRWFRDHGHRDNIVGAFRSSTLREPYDRTGRQWHIANTAHLFLKTKQALEENRELTVYAYPSALRQAA